ncbi:hypothetical protein [Croceicoccus marinus]|jgi:hypothetical protein|uniref:Flagellar hook-length control protein FliK n=1 Tax=Croceicoccus marinus TaxID=450378 RepID=A0A7G6VQX9_9SPHN|nr:hypothetical protein [Croceicoccus marinus]QNE04144.1 hypothetical protein H4O24_09005 [Croceicoccus marinus]
MNALPLFTLVSPKIAGPAGDGTVPAAAIMAGEAQAEGSETAEFSALLGILVVPPMIALLAADGAAPKPAEPLAGTGKNLPAALPVLPEAAAKGDAALAGAAKAVPAVLALDIDAIPEKLAAIVTPPKPAAETADRMPPLDPAAPPPAALLPVLRMAAVKQDAIPPAALQAMPITVAVEAEPEAGPEAKPAAPVDAHRAEAAPAARIMLAQNGAEMQVQFLAPPSLDARVSAAPAPATAPADRIDAFQGSQRLEELVQAIAHARETGTAQPVRATISHAEFGMLALKLTREDGGVTAQIASGDASFAPAAHAAVRAVAEAGVGQPRGDEQPRHHGAQPEQAQAQPGHSPHAQSGSQQGFAANRQQPRDAQSDPAAQAEDRSEQDRAQGTSAGRAAGRSAGLYA